MAENDEHESRAESGAASERPEAGPPAGNEGVPRVPPASEDPGTSPGVAGAPTEYLAAGGDPRGPGRWRRWSASGPARMGVVALVAGLIGGLVGGGIVAAFNGGDHGDRTVRVERAVPFGGGGGPGFRRHWGPPPGWVRPSMPMAPTPPSPPPSPKVTG